MPYSPLFFAHCISLNVIRFFFSFLKNLQRSILWATNCMWKLAVDHRCPIDLYSLSYKRFDINKNNNNKAEVWICHSNIDPPRITNTQRERKCLSRRKETNISQRFVPGKRHPNSAKAVRAKGQLLTHYQNQIFWYLLQEGWTKMQRKTVFFPFAFSVINQQTKQLFQWAVLFWWNHVYLSVPRFEWFILLCSTHRKVPYLCLALHALHQIVTLDFILRLAKPSSKLKVS